MNEVWKDIECYEGKYQVSNLGNVKSLNYNHTGKEKLLKPINANGYLTVHLSINNNKKKYKIHRLVAEAFIENHKDLQIINHKDENKSNNCVANLEWCDTLYNNNYGTRNQRVSKSNRGKKRTSIMKKKQSERMKNTGIGANNNNSKSVICLTTGEIFDCMKYGTEKYKINYTGISDCCTGKQKSAGKLEDGTRLVWMFLDKYLKQ